MRHPLTFAILLAVLGVPSAQGVSYPRAPHGQALPASRVEPELVAPQVYGPPLELVPVSLYDVNTRVDRLFILTREGELVGEDGKALQDFFACKRTRRSHRMSSSVLAVLAELSLEYPGHTIEIVSGFRRQGFGVKGSKHFTGDAIDLRVRGVPTPEVRDFLWQRYPEALGLGHYRHANFLHVDHRPREPKIGWTQRRPNSHYQYHPRWAEREG